MKRLVLILSLACCACAQSTKVLPQQLSCGTGSPLLLLLGVCVQLDPAGSIALLTTTNPPTLVAKLPALPATPVHVYGETPAGALNGSNSVFTLANAPAAGTLRVYLNGLRLAAGSDYTLSGSTITFTAANVPALIASATLQADYNH